MVFMALGYLAILYYVYIVWKYTKFANDWKTFLDLKASMGNSNEDGDDDKEMKFEAEIKELRSSENQDAGSRPPIIYDLKNSSAQVI